MGAFYGGSYTQTQTTHQGRLIMYKYHCLLESGRSFVLTSNETNAITRSYEVGYAAFDEAALMDDYLVEVERIDV